ncbi:MAG: LPS export ABC transporter permease LptG [Candidatus Binatia bacterium]
MARQFIGLLIPITAAFTLLYLLIDLFDRLDVLIRHSATAGEATRYFLYKIPLMLTQITPPAVVTAALLTYGLLGRRNEITALRAGGVSLGQTAVPVLLLAGVISLGALAWNETVVPYASRKFQYVNNVEIRERALRGVLSDRAIWYRGGAGFYHIDYVDRAQQTVFDLTIYHLDDAYRLHSVVRVPRARWTGERWQSTGAVEQRLDNGAFVTVPLAADGLVIPETLNDFLEVQREPEELSFTALRDRVDSLTDKGIDASHYLVDLYLKTALPFANAVLVMVAVPVAARLRRHPSIAATVGLGTALGFGYWVLLGLATSLGQSGAIPPMIAAWAANALYLLLGGTLFLSSE